MKRFKKFLKGWLIFIMASWTLNATCDNAMGIYGIEDPGRKDGRSWEFVWETIFRKIKRIVKYWKEDL